MPAQPAAGSGVVRAGVVARRARGTPGDVRAGRRAGGRSRVTLGLGHGATARSRGGLELGKRDC